MLKKLLTFLGSKQTAQKNGQEGGIASASCGQGPTEWHRQQIAHNREWVRDFWSDKTWRASKPDRDATGLPTPEELEPHWYILKYLCRWSRTHYDTAPQEMIDRAVSESLGISRTHAVLMRQGIHNARPIWPDTLIERNGIYPWATPEIHAFWSLLDGLPEDQLIHIGATAAARSTELKRNWREIHRIVAAHHPDYCMVLFRAAATPLHPCASRHVGDLHQAKARATFELIAARLIVDPLPCRNLALFGVKTPAELLEPGAGEAGQPPEPRQ